MEIINSKTQARLQGKKPGPSGVSVQIVKVKKGVGGKCVNRIIRSPLLVPVSSAGIVAGRFTASSRRGEL